MGYVLAGAFWLQPSVAQQLGRLRGSCCSNKGV